MIKETFPHVDYNFTWLNADIIATPGSTEVSSSLGVLALSKAGSLACQVIGGVRPTVIVIHYLA